MKTTKEAENQVEVKTIQMRCDWTDIVKMAARDCPFAIELLPLAESADFILEAQRNGAKGVRITFEQDGQVTMKAEE